MANSVTSPTTSDITTTGTTSPTNTSQTSENNPLGINEQGFMQMFLAELQNQDPTQPMSNSDMMQQLSQLTEMQNSESMKELIQNLTNEVSGTNPINNYMDLIGKNVAVQTSTGTTDQGQVLSIGKNGSDIMFEFANGNTYNVNEIMSVSGA